MNMSDEPSTGSAPHRCPNCEAPAYIGGPGFPAQCVNRQCPFYSEDCWVRWVMEIPDEELGVELDIEDDEATEPGIALTPWLLTPRNPKSAGTGQLDLPTWDDLCKDYLDALDDD